MAEIHRISPSIRRHDRYGASLRHAPCVVCVPAKNEAARLPGFLSALSEAFRAEPGLRGALVVALDGCTDGSDALLREQARHYPVDIKVVTLPPHPTPHAGRARRSAMEAGARLFPLESTILLTTDADTLVDRNWVAQTRRLMLDADMVCGDIWRDDANGQVIREAHEHHYHELHRVRRQIDPVAFDAPDPHPQNFGASLALRRDSYIAIGGCPEQPSNEDVEMMRRMRLHGFRVRQDRSVSVLTSSRRSGRAKGGLAEALVAEDARAAKGLPFLIVDPRLYLEVYRQSAELRTGFATNQDDRVERAVARLDLDRPTVETAWRVARSADAFVTHVLPDPDFTADIPLARARELLRRAITQSAGKAV